MVDYGSYVQEYLKSGKHINGLHRWMRADGARTEWLWSVTSFLPQNAVYDQRLWHLVHNVTVHPVCPVCQEPSKWRQFKVGYDITCGSKECIKIRRNEIRSNTNLEKYGHENAASSQIVKEKIRSTNQERYGVDNVFELKTTQDKLEATNLERYGVRRPLQNQDILEKNENTVLDRYGVSNPMQDPDIQQRNLETQVQRYGKSRGSMTDQVKEKQRMTNEARYGGSSPMHSLEVKERLAANNLVKYGYEHVLQHPDIREKVFETMLERYGVKYPYEYNEFYEKAKRSLNERYGVDNPGRLNIRLRRDPDRRRTEEAYALAQDRKSEKHHRISRFLSEIGIAISDDHEDIDIYCDSHMIGIDFSGLYWHSNLFMDDTSHEEKTNECESKGIQLIHIWEDQWDERAEIIRGRLRSLFHIIDKKYNARSLMVKEVSSEDSRSFLHLNHIQGAINSSVRLGLYDGDELVSLMTFGKLRKIMGRDDSPGCWEMMRFCSKNGTIVRGGASKLLEAFKRSHPDWKMMISYADRSWSVGRLYETLGFSYMGNTGPGTWFIENGRRVHWFKYTKAKLVEMGGDPSKSSRELAEDLGLTWVCDSGSRRYMLVNPDPE